MYAHCQVTEACVPPVQHQCKLGRAPACLKEMLAYVRSLRPTAIPDYSHLRLLVLELPEEAPVSIAAYLQAEE